jgi:tryptophan synthase alpha chain
MQNRIDRCFQHLRSTGDKAFIAYICAGDPDLTTTVALALALADAGADIIELGVPFSDPLADGVVNQLAAQRALQSGTTVGGVLECVRELRLQSDIPVVLYTYLNPIYQFGLDAFYQQAAVAGVDGLLILDLPPDEGEQSCSGSLHRITLVAPTTSAERICRIVQQASGFIYYVSREGVTGERSSIAPLVSERVALIRSSTELPIVVGFGVSTPEQVRQIAAVADGVVVGSAIVRQIAEHQGDRKLAEIIRDYVRPLAAATKERRD